MTNTPRCREVLRLTKELERARESDEEDKRLRTIELEAETVSAAELRAQLVARETQVGVGL